MRSAVAMLAALLSAVVAGTARADHAPAGTPAEFNHARHAGLPGFGSCVRCHSAGVESDRKRPGQTSHDICEAAMCHASDFSSERFAETKICTVCHKRKEKIHVDGNIKPFPPENPAADFDVKFSHASHLTDHVKGRMHDSCLDCHAIDRTTGTTTPPAHAVCERCHGAQSKTQMSACEACHETARDAKVKRLPHRLRFAGGACSVSRKFSHERHRIDPRTSGEKLVSCGTCHLRTERAWSLSDLVTPKGRDTMTAACGQCHRPGQHTRTGQALFSVIGNCSNCHEQACFGGGGPTPSDHHF